MLAARNFEIRGADLKVLIESGPSRAGHLVDQPAAGAVGDALQEEVRALDRIGHKRAGPFGANGSVGVVDARTGNLRN